MITKKFKMTKKHFKKMSIKDIKKLIETNFSEALANYDFIPGVPHTAGISREKKLEYLAQVLRKVGMIPYVAFNFAAGESGAVPIGTKSPKIVDVMDVPIEGGGKIKKIGCD